MVLILCAAQGKRGANSLLHYKIIHHKTSHCMLIDVYVGLEIVLSIFLVNNTNTRG